MFNSIVTSNNSCRQFEEADIFFLRNICSIIEDYVPKEKIDEIVRLENYIELGKLEGSFFINNYCTDDNNIYDILSFIVNYNN